MNEKIKFKFDFKAYQRRFKYPLRTNYGIWRVREGIIISLTDRSGVVSQGEIAPLPWFGSETLAQAIEFCQNLGTTIGEQNITTIADSLPCCQFAFESAWLNHSITQSKSLNLCYLLPPGKQALTTWKNIYQSQTVNTLKWKIGVFPIAQEIEILRQLNDILPRKVKLRLDANGGLNLDEAQQLLSLTDTLSRIEFIEQPLSPDNLSEIFSLSQEHITTLALDESIASFESLQSVYQQGWQGVYVIKAAIMGFPSRLTRFCQDNSLDIVFSSVFETKVGRSAVLNLAQKLAHPRAVGFGVDYFMK